MILHTVNKSPAVDPSLGDCLRLALPGSGILLFEDGVYGALDTRANRDLLGGNNSQAFTFYVLEPDLQARGLGSTLLPLFDQVTYAEFVELCLKYSKVQNWY